MRASMPRDSAQGGAVRFIYVSFRFHLGSEAQNRGGYTKFLPCAPSLQLRYKTGWEGCPEFGRQQQVVCILADKVAGLI